MTASATTHSFEPGDFPTAAKWPAIGGRRRRRFGLRRDDFQPAGDFGRVVSGPEIPVPGGSIGMQEMHSECATNDLKA